MDPEELSVPPAKKQKCEQAEDPDSDDTKEYATKEETTSLQMPKGQSDDSLGSYLLEKDVGITEYVGKHSGFFAVLKQRYPCVCTAIFIRFHLSFYTYVCTCGVRVYVCVGVCM